MKIQDKIHRKCKSSWGVVKKDSHMNLVYDPFGITGFGSWEEAKNYIKIENGGEGNE